MSLSVDLDTFVVVGSSYKFAIGVECKMQQMLKTKKEDDKDTTSAFYSPGSLGKSPPAFTGSPNKRDSGYGTDYSPASVTSTSRRFTYDDVDNISEGLDNMDFNNDLNNVFVDTIEEGEENDEAADNEVAELFHDRHVRRPVSQPIQIIRPSAPIPTPEGDDSEEDFSISEPFHHTPWTSRDRRSKGYRFRPIVSRSVGTQTPSPHSQIIREAVSMGGRFQPYARGTAVSRLRMHSESETNPPLPDLVPLSRDRSVSLPDVPSFRRDQEVGRELRRIGDEFHSSFTRVDRRRTNSEQASSFPMRVNIDFYARIRRYLSSSPLFNRPGTSHNDGNDASRATAHRKSSDCH